jgi:hypothetical protein
LSKTKKEKEKITIATKNENWHIDYAENRGERIVSFIAFILAILFTNWLIFILAVILFIASISFRKRTVCDIETK